MSHTEVNKLAANNLSKTYKSRKVVDKVSFDISTGNIVGLLGPNGAGKTTCFYMTLGLIGSEAGSIFLNDDDITGLPIHDRAKRGISYLPQEPSVFRKLSVKDNILAVLETRKDLNRVQRKEKLEELMEEFNITHVMNTHGASLSGGERRRVEIARCLAIEPLFILLDEPFAGVDPISIDKLKKIIQYLANKNIGIIITDHNVRDTLAICERAYILNEGKVICHGNPEEILSDEKVIQVYLGKEFAI